jgi:hypothetical protein
VSLISCRYVSYTKAQRELAPKNIGDVIFRPHHRNKCDMLGMSWKFGPSEKDVVVVSIEEQVL